MVMNVLLSWTTEMPPTLRAWCARVVGRCGEIASADRRNLFPPLGGGAGKGSALPSSR